MIKKLLLIILLLPLFACQSAYKKYDITLNNYMHQDESVIFAKFGQPTKVHFINRNTKVISYHQQVYTPQDMFQGGLKVKVNGATKIDTIAPMMAYDAVKLTHAMIDPAMNKEFFYDSCMTNFTVSNGIVVDYGFNGDGCGKIR